ncbi:hypothetical protein EI982_14610 [Haloplanus rallus]|uniref:Uncharacterized protein n=1 Tax=Haloplanus rallus TaxID=1816183 RepID=A0A6B9FG52_9EURY|nr:hypothetical protein [Haloplanus rallus]QGX95929.1 hypothetical protein EI982_14610 [Haloplanus rallus]
MARRKVGTRQRASDESESRLDALKRRVSELRSDDDDGPGGVDARTRGDYRTAVDAREVDVDDEDAAAANQGEFDDGVPTAEAPEQQTTLEKLKRRAADELKGRAGDKSAEEILRDLADDAQSPRRAPGTTGTQTEDIAKRATDAAAIRSPMGGSLRTIGDERVVTDMARAAAAEGNGMLTSDPGLTFRGGVSGRSPRADDTAFVGVGVGFGMEDRDESATGGELSVDDPFGLTGGGEPDRDDDDDDDVFPGLRLPGGDE